MPSDQVATRAPTSIGPRIRPTIRQHVLPGDVPGVLAAQEGAGRAELVGRAEALRRASNSSSIGLPVFFAAPSMVAFKRSVSYAPGNRLLMVTLADASFEVRARPATNPVSPLRAPLDSPRTSIGAFTAADVMLT